jgi:hypothetical protein
MCDEFLAIVATALGEQHAERYAAILLTGVATDTWHTTDEDLTEALVAMVAVADRS